MKNYSLLNLKSATVVSLETVRIWYRSDSEIYTRMGFYSYLSDLIKYHHFILLHI